jgi:uncharacterized protein YecT (DUF1311 family)
MRMISIKVGDVRRLGTAWLRRSMALVAIAFVAAPALGVDDPDAPDLMAEFEHRAVPYEARISEEARTTLEIAQAYADYQRFLDAEMTKAYRELATKLAPAPRVMLTQSQRRWLAYRDAGFHFIDDNWTQAQFGTSATLSRGAYRCSIVKGRVTELIQYLKNYH